MKCTRKAIDLLLCTHEVYQRYCRLVVGNFFLAMTSLKYDIPLLDQDTRFSLWQVKMRAVLAHTDLDDALDGFNKKPYDS